MHIIIAQSMAALDAFFPIKTNNGVENEVEPVNAGANTTNGAGSSSGSSVTDDQTTDPGYQLFPAGGGCVFLACFTLCTIQSFLEF